MTITLGWWALPLILSLIGSGSIIIDDLQNPSSDMFGLGAAFSLMAHIICWGVPWGIYGVCRAIFG